MRRSPRLVGAAAPPAFAGRGLGRVCTSRVRGGGAIGAPMISAADFKIYGPGPGTQLTVSGTSSAAQDLGAGTQRVVMKCAEASCIRFGDSAVGAAVTTDFALEADKDYVFDVSPGTRYFRVIQLSSGGLLTWAKVA